MKYGIKALPRATYLFPEIALLVELEESAGWSEIVVYLLDNNDLGKLSQRGQLYVRLWLRLSRTAHTWVAYLAWSSCISLPIGLQILSITTGSDVVDTSSTLATENVSVGRILDSFLPIATATCPLHRVTA